MRKLQKLARKSGVMGINCRNVDYVFLLNPRKQYELIDNKLTAKSYLEKVGIPIPTTIFSVRYRSDLPECMAIINGLQEFVIKPAHGLQGQGITVITGRKGSDYLTAGGKTLSPEDLRMNIVFILSGMFSISGTPDLVIIEQYVREHQDINIIHRSRAVSDIRVILYKSQPTMAMMRVPCSQSGGVANLHAGGIGLGVNMNTGMTTFGIQNGKPIDNHPDTQLPLKGHKVPGWQEFVNQIKILNEVFKMDYLGVDVVVDQNKGPMVLEVNARPGLDIQLANRKGLLHVLREKENVSEVQV